MVKNKTDKKESTDGTRIFLENSRILFNVKNSLS